MGNWQVFIVPVPFWSAGHWYHSGQFDSFCSCIPGVTEQGINVLRCSKHTSKRFAIYVHKLLQCWSVWSSMPFSTPLAKKNNKIWECNIVVWKIHPSPNVAILMDLLWNWHSGCSFSHGMLKNVCYAHLEKYLLGGDINLPNYKNRLNLIQLNHVWKSLNLWRFPKSFSFCSSLFMSVAAFLSISFSKKVSGKTAQVRETLLNWDFWTFFFLSEMRSNWNK